MTRIFLAVSYVVHAPVVSDLPPTTGHIVEAPGVGPLRPHPEWRPEAHRAGAVLLLELLGESRVRCAYPGRVLPFRIGGQTDGLLVLLREDGTEPLDVVEGRV